MSWAARDSFRTQIAVIALASLSMAAVAVILVRDVLRSTEQTLVREAQQQCVSAARELRLQFHERAVLLSSQDEAALRATPLPFEAENLSLKGLSAAVLRSYEGVAGGFFLVPLARVAGFVAPSAVDAGEEPDAVTAQLLERLVRRAEGDETPQAEQLVDGSDVWVGAIEPLGQNEPLDHNTPLGQDAHLVRNGSVAWAVKRLAGLRDPDVERRRWWLAGLVLSALLGLGGLISISIRLRRGVDTVNLGLHRLESDFTYRLPGIGGDFGEIAKAINQMAGRRQALEASLRQQDRLAALGKVVAGVAHEIRNPLNSIRLTLELLGRRVRKRAVQGGEVEGAIEEVDRLDRILARLLAFGRPELEDRRVQDVRPLLERAVKMVQEQSQRRNVPIMVEDGGEPLEADVDGLQVEQVLLNLLLNAIEASPGGSPVHVEAKRQPGSVRIAVADGGQGIPESIRNHVFDPYFTTKETGSGLGLAVSREVVSHHDGELTFESNGNGTTFVLRLPARREQSLGGERP
jgi:signal transduction histidine kinase